MATVPVTLDLNLQSTYGVLLIGCFLSAAVWGVSFVQTFLYFMMYEKDPFKLKLLILFLITIDTANEILVLRSVWPGLILHWGRVDVLGKSEGTIELIHHVWVAAIVAVVVQSYYTWRIYTLSGRKRLIPCLLIPLIAWQIIGLGPYNFLALGHAAVSAGKQTQQLTAVAISLRAAGAAADILITGTMIYLLTKPNAQFTSTQKLVFRLLVLSINSGAWTAILALLDLISIRFFHCCVLILIHVSKIVAFPVYFTFCIFELPICSLYLSTLLVNLNARKFISNVPTSIDLADMSGNRSNGQSAGTIHFMQQGSRTAYLSHADSGASSAVKKVTLPSRDDTEAEKDGNVTV